MKQIAIMRGGKCLSSAYKNQNTRLDWLCGKCGNKWNASFGSISMGHWCPKCAIEKVRNIKIKYTIKDMQRIALDRGGKCLSKIYLPSNTKLKWQCKRGHIWDAIPNNVIKKGTWCQKCAAIDFFGSSQRLTIDWFKDYAKKQGGVCLTEEYKNAKTTLFLVCKHGHKWKTEARHISAGSWCHTCGGSKRSDLEDYRKIAKERGGECLSNTYQNQRQKLKFKCENGHIFEKDGSALKNTTGWCPECAQNTGERICKVVFEGIFHEQFNPAWPDWLRNSNNQPMELDGYNEKLKIAFEHQGEQHYSTKSHWITSYEGLARRKKDDRRKYYLSKKNGVSLFRIPQVPNRISAEKIIPFIVKKAQERGIQIPNGWESLKIDFYKVYHGHGKERLNYCKLLAEKHNGKFISNEWKGEEYKYTWMCSNGHEWQTLVRNIANGNWCKYCSGKAKLTLKLFQDIAIEKGGLCISEKYVSRKEKLKFRCKEGHEFVSTAGNVKVGKWCAICAKRKKYTIKEMQELAKSRNGKCLSKRYKNNKSKLLWECENGHRWETTPKKVLIGQWCIICKRDKLH